MSSSMHICVTIFSTDSKFQPVSNFTELHAIILAARSYALLVEVKEVSHTQHTCHHTSPHCADSTKKPGPGAYSPEKVTVNKPSAPGFSMGIRHSEYVAPLIVEIHD